MFAATGAVNKRDPVTATASVVVDGVVVEPAIRTVEPAAEIAAGAEATTVHVADPPTWYTPSILNVYVPAAGRVTFAVAAAVKKPAAVQSYAMAVALSWLAVTPVGAVVEAVNANPVIAPVPVTGTVLV